MDTFRVAIVGAGFGGIGLAVLLKRAGISHVLLDKGAEVGGTWRDNTYPGAACDVPSHLYSFSFERWTGWTRRFAEQPEILDYLRHCVDEYGLEPRLDTEVRSAVFEDGRWLLDTSSGPVAAEVLVSACGQLNRPAVPDLPGLEGFEGKVFHSARWDHEHDVTGRKVAVVGTGASAIQFVPHLAAKAARLDVYQRSATWIIPKPDRLYGPLARRVYSALPLLQDLDRLRTYLLLESRAFGFVRHPALLKPIEHSYRRRLRKEVADPELRRKLLPDHPLGCKRVLISDDYLPALQRPNVDLVTDPIREVRRNGVVTGDGAFREADTIVLGTGFRSTEFLAPMRVTGRDGLTLDKAWADGAEAHLGMTVHGFPNLYLLYGPNTNLGHSSIVYMLESQFRYILGCLQIDGVLEVRKETQNAFNKNLQERMRRTVWDAGCRSWYQTEDGKHVNNWPSFTFAYRRATRRPDPRDFSVG
ncbi:NAD(P)/FAD-dependent oxidoreductase [Actinocorallia aurantiaca]|uniref:NAD(P)/FAD-dependent oxidoreductase n=1 Tax=Actinocorallia aurantiaca TaxID=46204 RepID=A0ABN3U9Z5_9ACTN